MSAEHLSPEVLGQRVSRLEAEVARLALLIEGTGVTRTGDQHRPGEFELRREQAASTRP
jgi:hypothetical protein